MVSAAPDMLTSYRQNTQSTCLMGLGKEHTRNYSRESKHQQDSRDFTPWWDAVIFRSELMILIYFASELLNVSRVWSIPADTRHGTQKDLSVSAIW